MTRTSNIQGLFMQINGGEMQIFIVLVESRFVNLFIPRHKFARGIFANNAAARTHTARTRQDTGRTGVLCHVL